MATTRRRPSSSPRVKTPASSSPRTNTGATKTAAQARLLLRRNDPVLGAVIDAVGPYRLRVEPLGPSLSIVAALAESIVYQQLTAKAAATIHARVVALGTSGFPTSTELLALDDGALRQAGLSANKVLALKDLAQKHEDGLLPTHAALAMLSDDEIVQRLCVVRGIGPWTVQMLLMFKLGRPDVLPTTDYGVQKGFQRVFGTTTLPTPRELLAHGERWRPHRSMASWYLWRALDLPPDR